MADGTSGSSARARCACCLPSCRIRLTARRTWGLVIEVKRRPEQTESLLWFCEGCDRLLHQVSMHVADIEGELKAAIEGFDASLALRTCGGCGHVHPERAPLVAPVTPEGRSRG